MKIHEIWHFSEDQRVEGLFTGYVDTLLKMKQESSGRPSHVRTPEELQNYINHYEVPEGIQMEPGKIVKNAAKRSLAKLMLNAFWGKFGERLNKSAVESVTAPHELFEYLNNSLMVIHAIRVFSEDVLEVVFSYVDEDASEGKKTNIFIAAFTTAQARLKLYNYLDPLRDQVLYYDTYSVIYSCKPGQTTIALGDYLGDMTSELNEDDYINEVMKQNVLEEITDPLDEERRTVPVTNPYFFVWETKTKKIKTVERIKQYGLVFDKRVIDEDTFMPYPYGYKRL